MENTYTEEFKKELLAMFTACILIGDNVSSVYKTGTTYKTNNYFFHKFVESEHGGAVLYIKAEGNNIAPGSIWRYVNNGKVYKVKDP